MRKEDFIINPNIRPQTQADPFGDLKARGIKIESDPAPDKYEPTTLQNPFDRSKKPQDKIPGVTGNRRNTAPPTRTYAVKQTAATTPKTPKTAPPQPPAEPEAPPVRPENVPEQAPDVEHKEYPAPPPRTSPFVRQKTETSEFQPEFYVSGAAKRMVQDRIEKKQLTAEELPFVYDVSTKVGKLFNRQTPTMSDIELAIALRTRENIQNIAEGKAQFIDPTTKRVFVRKEAVSQNIIAKPKLNELWKTLAAKVLEQLNQAG